MSSVSTGALLLVAIILPFVGMIVSVALRGAAVRGVAALTLVPGLINTGLIAIQTDMGRSPAE